ncbi:MAG: hypothetical protein Q7S20_09525 [Gemmatimonadaceae bacterium]|nr:hypothetical protein [Gemmatimonadaceae bacterium]
MTAMWVQRVIAAAIVLMCAAFLARRAWRAVSGAARPRGGGGCGPGCG